MAALALKVDAAGETEVGRSATKVRCWTAVAHERFAICKSKTGSSGNEEVKKKAKTRESQMGQPPLRS